MHSSWHTHHVQCMNTMRSSDARTLMTTALDQHIAPAWAEALAPVSDPIAELD